MHLNEGLFKQELRSKFKAEDNLFVRVVNFTKLYTWILHADFHKNKRTD